MVTGLRGEGVSSRATIELDRAHRYAKQLASHLGHKARVEKTDTGWELFFDPSRATVIVSDDAAAPGLDIAVWSPTPEGLESVQGALERHLQAFTARQGGVVVVWREEE